MHKKNIFRLLIFRNTKLPFIQSLVWFKNSISNQWSMKTTTITKDFFLYTLPFQFLQYWIWYVRSLVFLNRRIWIGTTFINLGLYQIRCNILIVHFHIHWLDEYFQHFQNISTWWFLWSMLQKVFEWNTFLTDKSFSSR